MMREVPSVNIQVFYVIFVIITSRIARMEQINGSGSKQLINLGSIVSIPLVMNKSPVLKAQPQSVSNLLTPEQIKGLKVSEEKLEDFFKKIGKFKETALLKSIREAYKEPTVANLTPPMILQFCQTRVSKMLKNHRLKKNWGTQDIFLLIWLISKYMELHRITSWEQLENQDWAFISSMIPGSNPQDCQFKWLNLNKNKLGENSWSHQQSRILSDLVEQYGLDNWKTVAQNLYFMHKSKKKTFRTAKQCKERWSCYENPAIKKGQWTLEEDKILMQEVYKNGGHRKWCQISKILHQRTENAIKNRYKLLLQKQESQLPKDLRHNTLEIIKHFLNRNSVNFQVLEYESDESSINKNEPHDKSETSIKLLEHGEIFSWKPDRLSAFSEYKIRKNQNKYQYRIQEKYSSDIRQTLQMSYNFMKSISSLNNTQVFVVSPNISQKPELISNDYVSEEIYNNHEEKYQGRLPQKRVRITKKIYQNYEENLS